MKTIPQLLGSRDGTVNARYAQLDVALQPPVAPDSRLQPFAATGNVELDVLAQEGGTWMNARR